MAKPALSHRRPRRGELPWNDILVRAKQLVESYSTGVTLRQLYYRLVSEGWIPNKQQSYKTLSAKSAQARREGWFPALIDRTREIEQYQTFPGPRNALNWLEQTYRRDRTEGQDYCLCIGVEKHGLTTQLMDWFGDLGIPIMALGGYSSQTFVDEVTKFVQKDGRESILIYAGDFDPSGMDIDRDFVERGMCFDDVVRVALTAEIVAEYDLPPMPGKATDSRSTRFMYEHGDLVQVELDALPPEEMRKLYAAAIDEYWDHKTYDDVLEREDGESELLKGFVTLSGMSTVHQTVELVSKLDDKKQIATLRKAITARAKELK